jgi:hypothetical protein
MILATITSVLRVVTDSVADLHIATDYADMTSTTFTPNAGNVIVNTATTVNIVASPPASTQRQIKSVLIANRHATLSNNVNVELFDGINSAKVYSYTLGAGQIIQYKSDSGWSVQVPNNTEVLSLKKVATEPSTPPSETKFLYADKIADVIVLKTKSPTGIESYLQEAFWNKNITMWTTTNASAGLWLNTVGAGAGTGATSLPSAGSVYSSTKRALYSNVVTTLNQVLGQRNTESLFSLGNGADQGGFFFHARFGFNTWTNGGRFFGGFATATTVISANPSLLNNTVGFAIDDTDGNAIQFISRDTTTTTKVNTGLTAGTGKGYDIFIFCEPNGTSIGWKIKEINNGGAVASGTVSTNLPANSVFLTANVLASNAALTPVNSIQLGVNKIYVEANY